MSGLRPILVAVDVTPGPEAVTASVILQIANTSVRADATRDPAGQEMAVAAATLRALTDATGLAMRPEAVDWMTLSDRELAVVLVEIPALGQSLAGAVVAYGRSDSESFARAALDAVNRIVENQRVLEELSSRAVAVR